MEGLTFGQIHPENPRWSWTELKLPRPVDGRTLADLISIANENAFEISLEDSGYSHEGEVLGKSITIQLKFVPGDYPLKFVLRETLFMPQLLEWFGEYARKRSYIGVTGLLDLRESYNELTLEEYGTQYSQFENNFKPEFERFYRRLCGQLK